MTKELDNKLLEILNSTTNAIGEGVDFLTTELPDVVYQLLLWYGVYSGILFLTSIIILVTIVAVLVKYSGQGEKISDYKHKWTLTHDDDGDLSPISLFSIGGSSILSIVAFHLMNLTWLKIWITPKIWLIEYSASLVKG